MFLFIVTLILATYLQSTLQFLFAMGEPIMLDESEKSDSFTFPTNIICLPSFQILYNALLHCIYFVILAIYQIFVKSLKLHMFPFF